MLYDAHHSYSTNERQYYKILLHMVKLYGWFTVVGSNHITSMIRERWKGKRVSTRIEHNVTQFLRISLLLIEIIIIRFLNCQEIRK